MGPISGNFSQDTFPCSHVAKKNIRKALMQHVVPELGLAEVIVATGKLATPHQATASDG